MKTIRFVNHTIFLCRIALFAAILPTAVSYAADVKAVQKGTTSISSNGGTNTVTVTLGTAIDPTKSFLIFQTRHNGNRPVNSFLRGRIASSTSLEFVRVSDETAPGVTMNIQWYVVEYNSGVFVQRGEISSMNATAINVTLPTPVSAVNQAFVTWSKTTAAVDGGVDNNDPILAELTTTSNLQFRVNTAHTGHVIWWEVVEYTDAADINVQKGSIATMTSFTTSVTGTLAQAVDVTKSFVLVGYTTSASGSDIGARMLRAQLTNSTTVTIDRSISGTPDDITEIVYQVVELKDASTVQRGSATLASAASQGTVALTSVDVNRAIAFGSVQSGGGQNMGRTSYATDDILGVGSATMALTATQLTIDRNNTAAATDIGWFVVEFGTTPLPAQYRSRATGNWDAYTSWDRSINGGTSWAAAASGETPGVSNDETVLVRNGHTITLNTSPVNAIVQLTVGEGTSGTLRIGSGTLSRSLTVNGDITILSGGNMSVYTLSNATHTLSVSGNIANAGTFDMQPDADSFCNVTFNKNGNQTVSGSGATTGFNNITVNMGSSNSNVLDVTATNFSAATGFLTLTNGTFKLSSNVTVTPFTSDIGSSPYRIPATAGLWVNGGTIAAAGSSWTIAGLLRLSSGTLNVGNASGHYLAPQSGATVQIEGGSMNVADRVSQFNATWTFIMSSGTLTVPSVGSATADRPPFNMQQAGGSFSMSGGTIIIERAGGSAGQNSGFYNIATGGTGFTGGTLQIGSSNTPASQTIKIETTRPMYNLTVNSANATALLQTNSVTVTNDVTIAAGTLDANNLNITTAGNWDNSGTFTPGTGTVTFNKSGAQNIGGSASSTFNNLTLSGSGTKTATGAMSASGAFNNSVTFDVVTYSLTLSGTKTNSGTVKFAGASNGIVFSDGTVEYYGTAAQAPSGQTVAPGTYNLLVFSNSAVKKVAASTTVIASSDLTIQSGTSVSVELNGQLQTNGTLTTAGSLTNEGIVRVGM